MVVFSPHPLLLGKERELVYAAFLLNETILEYLRRTGLLERMGRQPFILTVDGRRLPRTLWAHCRPKPGTLINLYAVVRGGGGGKKNPIATIALIALTVFAPQFAVGIGGAAGVTSAAGVGFIQVGVMVVGGLVINSLFPPPRPDLARAQNLGGGDSPNYAIAGGANRMRRYEPMAKIVGVHRVFPDFGAQPYNEFEGNDQVAYYVFDFGYNDAELASFQIGDTPIEEFQGVEMETSGADGKLSLFPANVDSIAGVELTAALGFVQRTSAPDARSIAVEITGSLFFLADEGTDLRAATVDVEYRLSGAGAWTPLQLESDAVPATAIVEGVARVPASQYVHAARKEISAQPVEPIGLTVLSASVNTQAGTGTLTFGFDKGKQSGTWRWTPPGGQMGEAKRVREGGQFVLYDGTRTMTLLINVTNHLAPFQIEVVPYAFTIGPTTVPGQILLLNATREPLRRTFKWNVAQGQYEVRVKKSTADETSQRAVAQIVWSQLRTYQPDDADYSGRLRVALKVRASALANGVLQQLSCIARARTRVWGEGVDYDVDDSGTAQAGSANTLTLRAGASSEVMVGDNLVLVTGPGSVQERSVSAYDGGTKVATVSPGWGTNAFTKSSAVDHANWTKENGITITADAAAAPDGTIKAERVQTDGISLARYFQTVTGFNGKTVVFALKMRSNTGVDQTISLHLRETGFGTNYLSENKTVTPEWQTFSISVAIPGGSAGVMALVYDSSGTKVWDFFACEHQWNEGSTPGEFIETEASAITLPDATTGYEVRDPWPIRHTSNPAWWYLDALRGKTINGRRVYGGGLADARIDIEGLKAFAAWCDAEGLSFNGVFDQQVSLFELLSSIALAGRGTPTMQTGKHGVLWDAPALPVTALFGMHNIFAGSFEVEYATGDLADVIEYWFINPELNWQRDFVRALVPGATSQARVRRVEGFGCTVKQQAGENASLYAAQQVFRARRYKWRSDWEQMPSPRGDVVEIGHDLLNLLSGRLIEGGNTTTLKLPRKVPLFAPGGFVTIVEPDGGFATYAVDDGVGESDTLTLPSPLPFDPFADPNHPPYDYRWHYGPAATTGRKVKIESFKPVSERYVDVSAVDEDPAYYASKDNALAPLPAPHLLGQVQLQALDVTEDGVRAGTGYLARVLVSWDVIGDYGFADVRASIAGGPMELLQAGVRGRSYAFNVQDLTDVVVEVTAWSSFGRHGKSSKLTLEHHVDYAGKSTPSDVTDFFLDGLTFRWSRAPELDVVGSRIRFHYGVNRNITDANELHNGLLASSPATFDALPAGLVTFLITEVDAAGLESETPAIILKDLGDPELANVVEAVDFDALGYPGTLTGGTLSGGDLLADGTTAFYGADAGAFYGADADPFYEDEVYEEMVYTTDSFFFSIEWIESAMTLKHVLEGLGVLVEHRTTNADVFYGADGDDFYGADAESFYGADGEWRAFTCTITYAGGDVQLRVTTAAGPVQGAVRELSMVIDLPDIVEDLNDIAIPQGGARLPITKDFDVIKTVQLTLQDDGGLAVTARYLDKDPDLGPLVECFAASEASTSGILDATIKGR